VISGSSERVWTAAPRAGAVLSALGRQRDHKFFQVHFRPPQRADFLASLSGENQQLDDFAIVRIWQGVPDDCQFAVGEHAIARLRAIKMLVGPDHWVYVAEAFAYPPREER
jgi:hypothetical protein